MAVSKFKVVVSDYDYSDLSIERSVLEPIGAQVVGAQCKTGEGLLDYARDADAILIQYAKVYRPTIERLERCKALCRYGAGIDVVDVEAAYEHGMVVTNVPHYCVEEVAEHAVTLAFTLLRRIQWYAESTRAGKWHWTNGGLPVHRFSSLTWGQIALGQIARRIVKYAQAFGFKIVSYDPYVSVEAMRELEVEKVEFPELLRRADVVCVQSPLTKETRHLIGEPELRAMKSEAVLINCARGPIVDNKALYRALTEGWIASAGLDDPEEEPAKLAHWNPKDNPIFTLDNCLVTPHSSYYSEESIIEARQTAAEEAAAVLLGKEPRYLVRPAFRS